MTITVYMNDLIVTLRNKGVGCHIKSLCLASIMFADDLVLCTPSRHSMQELLSISESFCKEHCLSFNTRKTKLLIFGKKFESLSPAPLVLNNQPIECVREWKYLGCLVVSGREFTYSCRLDLCSFRRSVNSIVTAVRKPSEQVSMRLLHSFSIPILTYASEVKSFTCSEMYDCHVAVNNAIRRIFTYNKWESIRSLRMQFGYRDLYTLFAIRKKAFLAKLPHMGNTTITSLLKFETVK